ncbi:hypothetical protein [Fructilactobacillus frigidiflavus]|uniref:hypothetical protein n=1 Tax=Fructilactobacillus frigidiflavus TaxID=3242688 RepID=UPI0037582ACB
MSDQAVLIKLIIMALAAILVTIASLVWTYKTQATWRSKRFAALTILLISFITILIILI